MRSFIFLTLLCLSTNILFAQMDPVKWTLNSEKQEDGSYNLVFNASMEDGWVIYSQHTDPNGPVPTSFIIDGGDCLVGDVIEKSQAKTIYSDLFMVDVIKFKKEAIFVQNIKADCGKLVKASLEFMTCNGDRCLPPKEISFSVELN